jgi:uncharacterized protein (TIGR04551 family)
MGQGPSGSESKDEGPAEVAPDAEGKTSAAKSYDSGYSNQEKLRTKLIEVDGSFRFRGDFLHKFNLGQGYTNTTQPNQGPPPFPTPIDCGVVTAGNCGSKSLGTGNLRLRIEPTFNVTDQVRIRSQFDVFDNLILGSTPDSLVNAALPTDRRNMAQTDVLSNNQASAASTIATKRAWGEVDTELGSIRFGRMPWHFGRGMYFNHGDGRDADGGTTVDRLMILTTVYGHQLSAAWDFASQGYTIGTTDLAQKNSQGFPLDLTQKDDVNQYMLAFTRIDSERTWRERVASGGVVVNYGAQLVYRSQDAWTYHLEGFPGSVYAQDLNTTSQTTTPPSVEDVGKSITLDINSQLFIPSVWFKLGWNALTVEFEGTLLAGKMGKAGPLRWEPKLDDQGLRILQAGFVLASQLDLYSNSFFLGFETGGATGDQAELSYDESGLPYHPYLNYRWKFVPQPQGDKDLNNFHFSPDYHVDEILFRRILGTVSNAIYIKPSMTYWLAADSTKTREVGLNASLIYSLATVPVSTPGNKLNYGMEMDLSVTYRNTRENFYAGFTWAVFWPFGALERPLGSEGGTLWQKGEGASAAQAVRTFLGIRF